MSPTCVQATWLCYCYLCMLVKKYVNKKHLSFCPQIFGFIPSTLVGESHGLLWRFLPPFEKGFVGISASVFLHSLPVLYQGKMM